MKVKHKRHPELIGSVIDSSICTYANGQGSFEVFTVQWSNTEIWAVDADLVELVMPLNTTDLTKPPIIA